MVKFGRTDGFSRWKPAKYKDYLTVAELSEVVKRNPTRIKQLEKLNQLPRPIRIKRGRLQVRLYSPEQVKMIGEHFKNAKPGRPKK